MGSENYSGRPQDFSCGKRSAPWETEDVENPLNDETLTDNADGNDVPSSRNRCSV